MIENKKLRKAIGITPLAFSGDFDEAMNGLSLSDTQIRLIATATAMGEGSRSIANEGGYVRDGEKGIIYIEGTLLPNVPFDGHGCGITGYNGVRQFLAEANEDSRVKQIELDFESAGGAVEGLKRTQDAIVASGKPVKARVRGKALSAAYGLAASTSEINVEEGSKLGSIGVYLEFDDYSEANAKRGVKSLLFSSGFWKGGYSEDRGLRKEEKKRLQASVEESALNFFSFVSERRGMDITTIKGWEGDTFNAKDAKAMGLVDNIKKGENMDDEKKGEAITQADVDSAIKAAVDKALADAAAVSAEALQKAKDEAARTIAINALDLTPEVRKELASEAFASVPVEALTELAKSIPDFKQSMEEDGGAGVGGAADDSIADKITPEQKAANEEADKILASAGSIL